MPRSRCSSGWAWATGSPSSTSSRRSGAARSPGKDESSFPGAGGRRARGRLPLLRLSRPRCRARHADRGQARALRHCGRRRERSGLRDRPLSRFHPARHLRLRPPRRSPCESFLVLAHRGAGGDRRLDRDGHQHGLRHRGLDHEADWSELQRCRQRDSGGRDVRHDARGRGPVRGASLLQGALDRHSASAQVRAREQRSERRGGAQRHAGEPHHCGAGRRHLARFARGDSGADHGGGARGAGAHQPRAAGPPRHLQQLALHVRPAHRRLLGRWSGGGAAQRRRRRRSRTGTACPRESRPA